MSSPHRQAALLVIAIIAAPFIWIVIAPTAAVIACPGSDHRLWVHDGFCQWLRPFDNERLDSIGLAAMTGYLLLLGTIIGVRGWLARRRERQLETEGE